MFPFLTLKKKLSPFEIYDNDFMLHNDHFENIQQNLIFTSKIRLSIKV